MMPSIPNRFIPKAVAMPWFPEEAVTTPALSLIIIQGQQSVQRPADFEGPRMLEVFQLEKYRPPFSRPRSTDGSRGVCRMGPDARFRGIQVNIMSCHRPLTILTHDPTPLAETPQAAAIACSGFNGVGGPGDATDHGNAGRAMGKTIHGH
jgi:hypothetical protein